MNPSNPPLCQECGEHEVAYSDFVCRFCFAKLPNHHKRALRLSVGREDERHTRERALQWLKRNRRSTGTKGRSESRMRTSSRRG
jgi:hypothetical protein